MRYSDAAGVENHPQITDFIPRRYRTIAMLVITGVVSTFALACLHHLAPSLAAAIGVTAMPPFDFASSGSLATWLAAVLLLLSSALCWLIYSIRRHRIDDYRGRYRAWLVAGAACMLLSANSVAGLHHLLAYTLSHVTGWTALRAGAFWWLAVAGLPLAWVVVRTVRDMFECRMATALWLTAIGCYVSSTASYLGLISLSAAHLDSMLDPALMLVGHWFTLAAAIAYARYVVLDAQGLIPVRARTNHAAKVKATTQQKTSKTSSAPSTASLVQKKTADGSRSDSQASSTKAWVDGSRPDPERYDDECDDDSSGGSRKLSKADRKRLRKLKTQNRAA
jgi:hypothetical protein